MIKAIFFDVDNTLYSEKQAHAAAFPKVQEYAQTHLNLSPDLFEQLYKDQMAQMKALLGKNAAIHNRMIRFLRILEVRRLPLYHAEVMNSLYWNTLLENTRPEEYLRECLDALKGQGYLLGIGTNMTLDWQMAKLRKLGLTDYFSILLSSEEAGTEKPDPTFFRMCAEKAGLSPSQCLYIGDSLSGDVLGAQSAGMQALWYAPDVTDFSQHTGFSHYSQLQNLLSVV